MISPPSRGVPAEAIAEATAYGRTGAMSVTLQNRQARYSSS